VTSSTRPSVSRHKSAVSNAEFSPSRLVMPYSTFLAGLVKPALWKLNLRLVSRSGNFQVAFSCKVSTKGFLRGFFRGFLVRFPDELRGTI